MLRGSFPTAFLQSKGCVLPAHYVQRWLPLIHILWYIQLKQPVTLVLQQHEEFVRCRVRHSQLAQQPQGYSITILIILTGFLHIGRRLYRRKVLLGKGSDRHPQCFHLRTHSSAQLIARLIQQMVAVRIPCGECVRVRGLARVML